MKLGLLILFLLSIRPINGFSQFKIQKIAEFKIESLLAVEILDFHPQSKLYLGYINNPDGTEVALINEYGEIMVRKVLVGQGPNQSSSSFNSMAFSENGDIWIQTPFQILLYDQKLNLKKNTKYLSGTKTYSFGKMEVFPFFHLKYPLGFSFFTTPTGVDRSVDGRDFNNKNLLEIFTPDESKLFEIAPISDRLLYKNLDKSIWALYFPVFTLDRIKKKLYLTTTLDNEITVYDLITKKLESRIIIKHGEFKSIKGAITQNSLPSYKNLITLGAKNSKIFFLDGGLLVLDYIREIPSLTYEKKIVEDPTYHHFKDPNYHRLIIFDNTKQLTGDLPLPPNAKVMMSLPENCLLAQLINKDVEEDFIRYGVFKLMETK